MSKFKKTNVMRILDKNKMNYEIIEYDIEDGLIDGISVANKINKDVSVVYKTLVLKGEKNYYIGIIPVDKTLNLKKMAKCVNEKKVEMIAVKDILKITGYIKGGCSAIGMKKNYKAIIDESVLKLEKIIFSAGKRGHQVEMNKNDFIKIINADIFKIIL